MNKPETGESPNARLVGSKRLYQVVAYRIARMIEAHADDPGWSLPSERELAETLNVSRPSVREAVIALEMRGLVEVRGRAGIVVLPPKNPRIGFESLNTDIGPGPFELLQARLAVEASAAAIAAEQATTYDILRLEDCLSRMTSSAPETGGIEKGDRDFHLTIAMMTGNAIIVSIVEALWAQRDASRMWKTISAHIHAEVIRPLWVADHSAIIAAIRARDPQGAYDAMASHIRNVSEELMEADERGRFDHPHGEEEKD